MKWCDFRELFVQRFGGIETPAAVISNILNSQPEQNECLSVYASRLVTSLMSRWQNLNKEEIAVSVVLAQVARVDKRLRRSLFTTKISTRCELQQELKAFEYVKSDDNREINDVGCPDVKRIKLSANIKCHFCGKTGHKIADCRLRGRSEKMASQNAAELKKAGVNIRCFSCGQTGHISSRCPAKNPENKKKNAEKAVNFCTIEPKGILVQSGESFPYYFDSGAECSLIKESVSNKLTGKRIINSVVLRGIGNATICSTLQILSNVNISGYVIEVLFHVIPNNLLKFDILIGREILGQGFGIVTTANQFDIFKDKVVNLCSAPAKAFNLDEINTDLEFEDKRELISILQQYSNQFIEGFPQTRVKTGQLEIRLQDPNKTVQRRPYRLSMEEREIVRNKIKDLIQANIVRPSFSPFASPILLVKKKNGDDRMCVDYRELNANTISDKYPLPLISDQISRLGGAKYFTCLDMASGYHQIPVHPDSIEKTAFVTPDGQFEYITMPFGLKNAPSVFQRAVMNALGDLAYSYVVVYMDDMMILSSTIKEGIERLNIVLDVFSKAGFSFNIRKCAFLKLSVEYLGYEVKSGEIRPNPRKIKSLAELPPPQSIPQLRQFIGLASYFRTFIHKFSNVMKPLYHLLTTKNFIWKPVHESIRQRIILLLTSKPVLVIFDPKYPLELHTDASCEGYGAILLHRINGRAHVIEYYSKRTTDTESRYHSYELETLAVVNAVKHFRHYLHGRKFVIFTDCNSLKATATKIELSPRVHRWWAYLQSFDFEIQYKEGKRMAHVDFLSRNHPPSRNKEREAPQMEKRIELAEISSDWLLAEQQKDKEVASIRLKIENHELADDIAKTYEIRKGVVYRKIQRNGKTSCLPVIPKAFRWSIINNIHESIMHLGAEKTLDKVYEHFWFEQMSKYVHKFVKNCMTCQLSKPPSGRVPVELHPIPKVAIPWHTVHMDITGKLSGKNDLKEYVIVMIDAFTKYVLLYHTTSIDCKNCIRALRSSISLFGVPSRIIADQGRSFTGKDFIQFCQSQNIKLHLIATGVSRANGQVERVMSTIKSLFTAVETSKRSWQDALEEIQLAINCTTNRITKATPLELFIGKVARPLGLLNISDENNVDLSLVRSQATENMKKNADYEKERFDRNRAKIVKFNIGDYVLLRTDERHQTKLDTKYKGPFIIAEVLDNDRYVLKSLNNKRKYKYSHEYLKKLPEEKGPEELDMDSNCDAGNSAGVANDTERGVRTVDSTERGANLVDGTEKGVSIDNGTERGVSAIDSTERGASVVDGTEKGVSIDDGTERGASAIDSIEIGASALRH